MTISSLHTADVTTELLQEWGLVDSPASPAFDNLTSLAQSVFQVPVSLVSIVDHQENRQFFKSQVGLPEPWCEQRQTPLSHSFCKHVVTQQEPLVVTNAALDPRVHDNGAVVDLNVIAYLGAPIFGEEQIPVGSMCVIDSRPRKWTENDVQTIQRIARCASDVVQQHQLIDKLSVQEKQLKSLNGELAQSNEFLEQFAAVASHDLRAPLRKITAFCKLLELDCSEGIGPDGQKYIQFLQDGSQQMNRLIEELLSVARVESEDVSYSMVDCNEVLKAAIAPFHEKIETQHAQVLVDPLPVVFGNTRLLIQLFQNLVANSLKYRSQDTPLIRVGAEEQEDAWLFSWRDNGIGIPVKHQEEVFQIFKRLHPQSKYVGTGIGLSLCRRIVKRLGGKIWIDADTDEGTQFRFTIAKMKS